jgi:TetR/AcrR family fatty acid metabolism transcriptional regulator
MPRNGPSDLDVTVATQRRAQIMRAVMASIADEGLERTTMRNVAERAGVSTGTIAYYFKSKKDMVDAALLEASQQYMERFYREKGLEGPWSLDSLIDGFLASDNDDAGFVLQMIEVGLHNSELRGTHQWMVETGRANIEKSIRVGMEAGRFRRDIDPRLAAAMLHGVLIWWGSELMSNATSQDLARDVGRLALRLLEEPTEAPPSRGRTRRPGAGAPGSTLASIRSLLTTDPNLPRKSADALADAIEGLYEAFRAETQSRDLAASDKAEQA